MPLSSGTRLGPYEVLAALGAGGMGEVYRARDTRLKRDVAIKVLPDHASADLDRLNRFQREAELLATLNHPHIAAVYGLEAVRPSTGSGPELTAIVLELVEGATLADLIARGPMAVADALPIARQIAEALEAAHNKGVVHRDLKPSNVKVTSDGTVKVLDFGLAKMLEASAAEGESNPPSSLSMSPTLSVHATQTGVILGTAAYMSPEQARGRPVDRRTDIWAFGCVLYEMLTGRQAFSGPTVSDMIAAILEREPAFDRLPPSTPASVRRLLARCLDKDHKRRLRDIGDARLEIDDALTGTGEATSAVASGRAWSPLAAVGAVVVAAAGAALLTWTMKRPLAPAIGRSIARLAVATAEPLADAEETVAVSPDGRRIAYVAGDTTRRRIYVREIDRYDSTPVPGTEGADGVTFSDDGRSVAFLADRRLKTVTLAGGSPIIVREPVLGRGLEWVADGSILFNQATAKGIWRVRPGGDTVDSLTKLDPHEDQHRFPRLLPGGRAVLYSGWSGGGLADDQVFAHIIDTGQRRALVKGTGAQYLPTGHLVYVRGGNLFAVPFDPVKLELNGSPVVVLEGVRQSPTGTPQISFARDGTMVYVASGPVSHQGTLVWVDRRGVEQPAAVFDRAVAQPRMSPDGRRVAVVAKGDPDVWQLDLTRDTWTRVTFDGSSAFPLWRPDGRLTFSSGKAGPYNIHWRTTDANGSVERLFGVPRSSYPLCWSPDGRRLAFVSLDAETAQDIWLFDAIERGPPRRLLASPFAEGAPAFSPDGRSLAYVSNESGRPEIYVQPVDGPGEKLIVSAGGGIEPVWPRDSRDLFYRSGNAVMAVEVTSGPAIRIGRPRQLFDRNYAHSTAFWANWDADSRGQRFLMLKGDDAAAPPPEIRVIVNWLEELKQRVPTK